jgi:hypothetical protein
MLPTDEQQSELNEKGACGCFSRALTVFLFLF